MDFATRWDAEAGRSHIESMRRGDRLRFAADTLFCAPGDNRKR
jgi:hypothetical protein